MKVRYTDHIVGTDGRFGQAVFGQWRGREVARRYVRPHDPRTADQQAQRVLFSNGAHAYRLWTVAETSASQMYKTIEEAWGVVAAGRPVTGQNLFIAHFVETLATVNTTRLFAWLPIPQELPGPTAITHRDSSGDIQVTFTLTNHGADYTIVGFDIFAWIAYNPQTKGVNPQFLAHDNTHGAGNVTAAFTPPATGETSFIVIARYQYNPASPDSPLRFQYAPSAVLTQTT